MYYYCCCYVVVMVPVVICYYIQYIEITTTNENSMLDNNLPFAFISKLNPFILLNSYYLSKNRDREEKKRKEKK